MRMKNEDVKSQDSYLTSGKYLLPNLQNPCCTTFLYYGSYLKESESNHELLFYQNNGEFHFAEFMTAAFNTGFGTTVFIGITKNLKVQGEFYSAKEEQKLREIIRHFLQKIQPTKHVQSCVDFVPLKYKTETNLPYQRKVIRIVVKPPKEMISFYVKTGGNDAKNDKGKELCWKKENITKIKKLQGQEIYKFLTEKKQKNPSDHKNCDKIQSTQQCYDIPFVDQGQNHFLITTKDQSILQNMRNQFSCLKPFQKLQTKKQSEIFLVSYKKQEQMTQFFKKYDTSSFQCQEVTKSIQNQTQNQLNIDFLPYEQKAKNKIVFSCKKDAIFAYIYLKNLKYRLEFCE